jgi:hypothetical protein
MMRNPIIALCFHHTIPWRHSLGIRLRILIPIAVTLQGLSSIIPDILYPTIAHQHMVIQSSSPRATLPDIMQNIVLLDECTHTLT